MDGVGVAGGPIGVYRPEDRLTPPALRRAACDITSPRTGSSSLPCPRRPHELRASTMPSLHSFFGFAGPIDGARGELTREGAPLFPHFETKRPARGRMQKKPRALGAARGEVGGPRGVAIATQRCDSATPSFIPPLNNKRRAARKPPSACSAPKQKRPPGPPRRPVVREVHRGPESQIGLEDRLPLQIDRENFSASRE